MRLALYALFVLLLAVVLVWLSFTPLMLPLSLVVGPLLLLAAVVPPRWVPWLWSRTEGQR